MPATGALIGTPASMSDSVEPQTEAIEVEPFEDEHVGDQAQRVGELLLGRDHRQEGPLGQQAVADLTALGAAHEAGLAGGEGREVVVVHVALVTRRMPMVSSSWFMRGMPRVVTFSTWVSPRWKRAEPWAVGKRPTSADSGRMSVVPRPSMRTPSSTMRLRTSFLVSERTAALISRSRSGNSGAELGDDRPSWPRPSAALRSAFSVMALALATRVGADRLHPVEDVVAVVGEGELDRAIVGLGRHDLGHQLALELDRLADPGLGRLEPLGQDLLGHLGGAGLVVLPRVLGAAGLDHHDGDLGVVVLGQRPAGHDQLEAWTRRPPGRWGGGSRCPRSSRRCARRRSGRRRGCPRA